MVPERLPRITSDDADEIRGFIRSYVETSGCDGVVIGLSGGIDSAVVAKLAVDALGADRVHAMFMPSDVTSEDDYESTKRMAGLWGMGYEALNIQKAADEFIGLLGGEPSMLERGNIAARCRMTLLYGRAKGMNRLVLGTSNQSEYMMGYFTKHGDGAADAIPLVKMYKTSVRQLAKIIGIPQDIIDKPPSAGLWEGQTDEAEMGVTYDELDMVLLGIEHGRTDAEISIGCSIPMEKVEGVRRRVRSMSHKRVLPARPGNTY